MQDQAEKLFGHLLTLDAIHQTAKEKMSESAYLDFKLVKSHDEALKTCPKVFSALANTFGGVVVWGVDCDERTTPEGFRHATELRPFDGVSALLRRLNILTPFDAPYAKLRHIPVLEDGEADRGYVVSYVSPADPAPVMANDFKYYTRTGSNSVPMNDAVVRAIMLAQRVPAIELSHSRRSSEREYGSRQAYGWSYYLKLKNVGRVTIRNFALAVHSEQLEISVRPLLAAGKRQSTFDDLVSKGITTFQQFELYPGAVVEIVALEGQFRPREGVNHAEVKVRTFVEDISRDFTFHVIGDELPDVDDDEEPELLEF